MKNRHISYLTITNSLKIIKYKIEEGTSLNSTNNSLDPFDYHLAKRGDGAFKTMESNQIHSFFGNEEADEADDEEDIRGAQRELDDWVEEQRNFDKPAYCDGSNEVVKIFNQKYFSFFENPSVYAFRHCGNQCICEKCYENKGDLDLLKCVI